MNENGYKRMHVSDGTDSRYGNIFIIKANPVQNNGFGMYHSMTIGNDTETSNINIKSVILLLQVHSLRNRNTKPTEIGIVVPTL